MPRTIRVALLAVAIPVGVLSLVTTALTLGAYAALVVADQLYRMTH